MLIVSLPHLFTLYLTVFLAVLFLAWFAFIRIRRRSNQEGRRIIICRSCRATFTESVPYQRPRCPVCGVVQESRRKETR